MSAGMLRWNTSTAFGKQVNPAHLPGEPGRRSGQFVRGHAGAGGLCGGVLKKALNHPERTRTRTARRGRRAISK